MLAPAGTPAVKRPVPPVAWPQPSPRGPDAAPPRYTDTDTGLRDGSRYPFGMPRGAGGAIFGDVGRARCSGVPIQNSPIVRSHPVIPKMFATSGADEWSDVQASNVPFAEVGRAEEGPGMEPGGEPVS